MTIDPEIVLDMALSLQKIKIRRGLEFYILPQRALDEAPWIIIDKSAAIRRRFSQAIRKARALGTYALPRRLSGRLEVHGRKLVFVVEEEPTFPAARKMSSKWPMALKQEGDAMKLLAALLKRADLVTEAEAVTHVPADPLDDDDDDLSPSDWVEIFGEQAHEVSDAVIELSQLNELLPTPPGVDDRASSGERLREVLLNLDPERMGEEMVASLPTLLRALITEPATLAEALDVDSQLDVKDLLMQMGVSLDAYVRSKQAWAARLAQAEALFERQHELSMRIERDEADEDVAIEHAMLVAQYEQSHGSVGHAKDRANHLLDDLKSKQQALRNAALDVS